MNTKAKKTIAAAAALLLLLAAFFCVLLLPAPSSAHAQEASADASVFLPSSYEQYLELRAPKDIAVSDTHLAIADGNRIYIYARAGGKYNVFTHGAESSSFGQIQLDGSTLYFTDSAMNLYAIDLTVETLAEKSLGYSLSNFLIAEGSLYGATTAGNTTSLYALSLEGQTSIPDVDPIASNLPAQLPMTYDAGVLYYANNNAVYTVDVADNSESGGMMPLDGAATNRHPAAIAAADGKMYFIDDTGFYRSDLAGNAELLDGSGGYRALTRAGDKLYCIKDGEAAEFDLRTQAFTDYRITSASDAENRLAGAVDIARAGKLLVAADAGNNRISVCNTATGECSAVLPPDGLADFTPELVATDGDLIAVSSGARIFTCTYGEKNLTESPDLPTSNVRGLACVYGSVYYVTDNNVYGKLGGEEIIRGGYGTPSGLAADLYGDLFVSYAVTGEVRRFAESEFLKEGGGELLDATLPDGCTAFGVDFEGNLYTLTGDALCGADGSELATCDGGDYVFLQSAGSIPLSFAVGFEDSGVYFLFGDYIVKKDLGIPTLSGIEADGVAEQVFAPHGENLFIDIPAGTIGVRTELEPLKEGPACFPYSFYYRTAENVRGVLLAEKGDYVLVLLYEVSDYDRVFTVNLFRVEPELRQPVPEAEYWQSAQQTRYLTSAVSGYYFPCLHPSLACAELPRGAKVSVLGYAQAPERSYALIEYTENGQGMSERETSETIFFVPASYLSDVSPIPEEEGKFEPAWLKASANGVVFTADDGETLTVKERTRAYFSENGDGTYTARISVDGKVYTAYNVAAGMIDRGASDALRISLIVILTVTAVGIVGAYFYLLPRKKNGDV